MSLFWSQWQPQFFNAGAIGWLCEDWRIAVLRIPVAVHREGYLDHPQREWERAEQTIRAAIALGLYVVVDWHAHERERDDACLFFGRVARVFGASPNLIYEIWNEPHGSYRWREDIRPYHEAVVAAIRRHDAHNLVVVGTEGWCRRLRPVVAAPVPADNVAYAMHFYAASHGDALRREAAAVLDAGLPLFVTEWGTSEASGRGRIDLAEAERWLDFLDRHSIGAINWSVADKAESSAALLPGADPRGGWPLEMLSPSGRFVRERLRRYASGETSGTAHDGPPS